MLKVLIRHVLKKQWGPNAESGKYSLAITKSKSLSLGPKQKKVYRIEGRVQDVDGNAVSGAKFILSPPNKPHGIEFFSEPDGTFKIKYTSEDVEYRDFPHRKIKWCLLSMNLRHFKSRRGSFAARYISTYT